MPIQSRGQTLHDRGSKWNCAGERLLRIAQCGKQRPTPRHLHQIRMGPVNQLEYPLHLLQLGRVPIRQQINRLQKSEHRPRRLNVQTFHLLLGPQLLWLLERATHRGLLYFH